MQKDIDSIHQRFNRDAGLFNALYDEEKKGLQAWLNWYFRRPIYQRFDTAMEVMGNLTGKKIIDVGCGAGAYMTYMASKGAQRVLGIDLSEKMLEFAAKRIQQKGLGQKCELMHANFAELNLQEKFNFTLAMGVFDYLAEPAPFLMKLKTVTTEKVIASFPGYSLIRARLRKLRYSLTSRGNVYFYHISDIENIARAAGFHSYQIIPGKTDSGGILIASI